MSSEAITRNDLLNILNDVLPPVIPSLVGEIRQYAGDTVPTGWLECNGAEVAKSSYPDLYIAIGDLWGTASDNDHFVLPDLRGRVAVGFNSIDTDFNTIGKTGGLKDSIVPLHNHTQNQHNHTQNQHRHAVYYSTFEESGSGTTHEQVRNSGSTYYTGYTTPTNNPTTATNNETGEDPAGKNLQPYAVVKYIICTQ